MDSVDGDMETGTGTRNTSPHDLRRLMGALVIANVTKDLSSVFGWKWIVGVSPTPLPVSRSMLSTVDPNCSRQRFGVRISTGQNRWVTARGHSFHRLNPIRDMAGRCGTRVLRLEPIPQLPRPNQPRLSTHVLDGSRPEANIATVIVLKSRAEGMQWGSDRVGQVRHPPLLHNHHPRPSRGSRALSRPSEKWSRFHSEERARGCG